MQLCLCHIGPDELEREIGEIASNPCEEPIVRDAVESDHISIVSVFAPATVEEARVASSFEERVVARGFALSVLREAHAGRKELGRVLLNELREAAISAGDSAYIAYHKDQQKAWESRRPKAKAKAR